MTGNPAARSAQLVKVEARHTGWCKILVATLLRDGQTFTREIEDHGNAAGVLAFDPVRKTATVIRQLRAPALYTTQQSDLLEVIAGLVETGEPPAETATREAVEKAGLRLKSVEHVTTAWTMPGISTERMSLFLAEYSAADRIALGGGLASEHEDIEVIELPLSELAAMIDAGREVDIKVLALVQTLRLRRPELFI